METFIVKIDGKSTFSKSIITFLKSIAKTDKDISIIESTPIKSQIARSIAAGLSDVKKIVDGKKKPKTLKEFLDED